jgi:hypothetical protein
VRVLSPGFLAFCWSAGFGSCENFTPTPEENDQYSVNQFLVQYKQPANPLLSMHAAQLRYTPVVISGNDKNKQITLFKLTQSRINQKKHVNYSVNSVIGGSFKKILNQARRLFRPISFHLCHQKPNTTRETVPLRVAFHC